MITALIFILVLIVLVLIHEFGHFIAAKKNGVLVEEFGFGFPPRLFSKKIGETIYSINLIPLGGFVRLFGEEYHNVDNKNLKKDKNLYNRAFVNKTPLQKTIIITAGVVMNFLFGWILITALFSQGIPKPSNVIISKIQADSPGSKAGLKKNDVITSISTKQKTIDIIKTEDLINATKDFANTKTLLSFRREGKSLDVEITPRKNPPKGEGAFGIVIEQKINVVFYPWYEVPFRALSETFNMTKIIFKEIIKIPSQILINQKTEVEFTGPIGIAKIIGEAKKFGINAIIQIVAILSINLAVINILPFPALDGGRQVFIIYEWITGKRSNPKFEYYMNLMGIIILLTLSVVVTALDIRKLWI